MALLGVGPNIMAAGIGVQAAHKLRPGLGDGAAGVGVGKGNTSLSEIGKDQLLYFEPCQASKACRASLLASARGRSSDSVRAVSSIT